MAAEHLFDVVAVDSFIAIKRKFGWSLCAPFLAIVVSACGLGVDGTPTSDILRNALVESPPPPVAANKTSRRTENAGIPLDDSSPTAEPVIFDGTGRFVGGDKSSRLSLDDSRPVAQPAFFDGTGQFLGRRQPAKLSPSFGEEANDSVTLNLAGVSIPQAAKTILSDFLGVRYTVAPGLEGRITLQTPAAVSKSEAIELFQSALRSNNAALISAGSGYKIVPLDQATAGAKLHIDEPFESGEKFGSSLRVVQLKYVNASEIQRILEPISPRGGVIRVDDARNTITLSGSGQDIDGMLEAISVFDVDVMKGMTFAIVPVKLSQPSSITDELKALFSSEKEGAMARMVQFIPNKRLGAILVITPQPKYLARAVTWIKRLDGQGERNEKRLYTYMVQNRQAPELLSVLQSMFSNEGGARGSSASRNVAPQYQEANLQSSSPASQGGTLQPASLTTSSSGAALSQSKPSSSGSSSSGGNANNGVVAASLQIGSDDGSRIRVVADENKNALLIEATPAEYRKVMRIVGNLDGMPKQVLIEATIAEITLTSELKFGLRWYLQNKSASLSFTDDIVGRVGSVFPGFSYALKTANIATTLTALNEITDVNVISSPSLTVSDNKTAALQVGDQVPIIVQSAEGVGVPGAPIVNSVSYKDTGVILSITPKISDSGRVALDIEQEVSNVSTTSSSSINSPTISQRRVRTSVIVNDGEVLALGGLIKNNISKLHTQMPVLGDLPIVGNAFKMKDDIYDKTELVILLVPHVMRSVSDARQVTDEFRRELAIEGIYSRQRSRRLDQTLQRTLD